MHQEAHPVTRFGIIAVVALGACAEAPRPVQDGQWLWSSNDRAVFLNARQRQPGLLPGIWVSTISFDNSRNRLSQRLALPPTLVSGAPVALVVRFEGSIHQSWSRLDDPALASIVSVQLAELLRLVTLSGVDVAEVQLDYDCPTRRLERWATLVRALATGPLRGREVWITSLVAHLRQPEFGDLFRGVIAGHILQVFDTGEEASDSLLAEITLRLQRQRLPFRFGVGSFERVLGPHRTTDHRRWFAAAEPLAHLSLYRGLWVFPAGRPWTYLRGPAS
jgi:hypothetical protein